MFPPDKKEPHNKNKNKKKEGKEAPLNLNYSIKELKSDQQEANKSNKSFLIKKGAVITGRHRTTKNKILELLGARITRAMAAYKYIGP